MTFSWPWISRRAHEEQVETLKQEIRELKDERKLLLNRVTAPVFGGYGLLEEVPRELMTEPEVKQPEPPTVVDDVSKALRMTGGNKRRAAQLISEQNEKQYSGAVEVIQQAYEQGRAAATPASA